MGLLIQTQARLVRRPVLVWTLLGLAVSAAFPTGLSLGVATPLREPFLLFPSLLAAELGGRLFSREATGQQGMYLRALPVAPGHLVRMKVLVGLATTFVSAGLLLAFAFTPLAPWWQAIVDSGDLHLTPELLFLPEQLARLVLVFAASAYFAGSFARVAASRQAGVAGWIATAVLAGAPASLGLHGAFAPAAVLLALAALAFAGAARLQRRRAVGAAHEGERVLASPAPRDAWLSVPNQLLLVVVPVTVVLAGIHTDLEEYLDVEPSVFVAGLWLLFGLAHVPSALRQADARGLAPTTSAGAVLLQASGVGVPLWKSLRSTGPAGRCADCGRRRQVDLAACPACAGTRTIGAESSAPRVLPAIPRTPLTALLVFFAATMLVQTVVLPLLHVNTWEVSTMEADANVTLEVDRPALRELRGWNAGENWLRAPLYSMKTRSSRLDYSDAPRADLGSAQLALAVREPWEELGAERDPVAYVEDLFGPDARLRLSYGPQATPGTITAVFAQISVRTERSRLSLKIAGRCPELDEPASELMVELHRGDLSAASLTRGAALGAPVFRRMLQATPQRLVFRSGWKSPPEAGRVELRARVLAALDELVALHYGLADAGADPGDRIWSEIEAGIQRLGALGQDVFPYRLREHVRYLYPQLRALALLPPAAADVLERELENRSPHALLAAGLAGDERYFEACRRAFATSQPTLQRNIGDWVYIDLPRAAAGWALLAIDRERGAAILREAFADDPDPTLVDLAAVSGDDRFVPLLRHWSERTDEELGAAFRLRRRSAAERLRLHCERALLAIHWQLEPADYLEQMPPITNP